MQGCSVHRAVGQQALPCMAALPAWGTTVPQQGTALHLQCTATGKTAPEHREGNQLLTHLHR